jgi:hypothetical protein
MIGMHGQVGCCRCKSLPAHQELQHRADWRLWPVMYLPLPPHVQVQEYERVVAQLARELGRPAPVVVGSGPGRI